LEEFQPFTYIPAPPAPKFQHRYRWHVALFLLTLATTTYIGINHYLDFRYSIGALTAEDVAGPWSWARLLSAASLGLLYSVPILLILGAHEFGHYWYCRRHNVDATLPYFLPAPPPLFTGTFGAVIRIKEPFPSTRALFDIGIAGPIAGFVVLVPILYWGVVHSTVVKFPETNGMVIYFGEPLLLKAMTWWHFGRLPEGFDLVLHPTGFAAWFGMLATALNLLPFGQLDGGHIAYAVFGPRARYVSFATLLITLLLTLVSMSWISMALIMLGMAFFLGVRHPRIPDEGAALDPGRRWLAFAALLIFVLCFTPVPIETFLGK
jgi:membrane-associated protease RseP (regulator of RpoE activity)